MSKDDIAAARSRVEATSGEGEVELSAAVLEDGFTSKTIIGALFVGFIMLPGALYLGLVAGQQLGPAAEWVTIVLFAEVMRRSFLPMKRQEIYILYYVAAMLSNIVLADRGISGGPFGSLIWLQYFKQSPQARLVAREIPNWAVPAAGSHALISRTFLDSAWLVPIGILVLNEILGRIKWISMGYVLFRITSDVERLPFPMAPVAASGATALAEAATKEESWRWSVFSVGTVIGLIFGFFYVGIPVFTGVVFGKPLEIIPIPFFDLTTSTETILPGSITGISGDLGQVLIGFVLPFHLVAGSFAGSMITRVFPVPLALYHMGYFGGAADSGWTRGMDAFYTKQATELKFYMSFGIGLQIAVAIIGVAMVVKSFTQSRNAALYRGLWKDVPTGRGDVAIWKPLILWFVCTCFYVWFSRHLLGLQGHAELFPWYLLLFYGLVWTPINSFVSARMMGLTGSAVTIPFLKEMLIMKTGYPYVDIWYAPIPLDDYGSLAQRFRELELTHTKFVSLVKAEMFILPLFLGTSFAFWAFFWHTSSIPSSQFPFAQRFWPLMATFEAMFRSINRQGGVAWIHDSINPGRIASGTTAGLVLYGVLALVKAPALFFYGFIGGSIAGSGAWPPHVVPTFFGAWLGRKYFAKRFGAEKWSMYAPVLLAGFSCGTGLMAMAAIALALIAKSVNYLPF